MGQGDSRAKLLGSPFRKPQCRAPDTRHGRVHQDWLFVVPPASGREIVAATRFRPAAHPCRTPSASLRGGRRGGTSSPATSVATTLVARPRLCNGPTRNIPTPRLRPLPRCSTERHEVTPTPTSTQRRFLPVFQFESRRPARNFTGRSHPLAAQSRGSWAVTRNGRRERPCEPSFWRP